MDKDIKQILEEAKIKDQEIYSFYDLLSELADISFKIANLRRDYKDKIPEGSREKLASINDELTLFIEDLEAERRANIFF